MAWRPPARCAIIEASMKKFFTKGLIAILPLALTGAVLYLVLGFLFNNVGKPIGEALQWSSIKFLNWNSANPEHGWFFRWGAPFLGFAAAILLTFLMGFVIATFFGKKLYQWFEVVLKKLPVVRTVYPYAKQFTDFFFSGDDKKMDFKTAVAVPYPTPTSYAIGFVTTEGEASGLRFRPGSADALQRIRDLCSARGRHPAPAHRRRGDADHHLGRRPPPDAPGRRPGDRKSVV